MSAADDRKQPRTPAAWEGGGREGTDDRDAAATAGEATVEKRAEHNRRDVPGGSFHPARTPGGTGPSTRDTQRAVVDDANEAAVGRVELAGEIQVKPKRQADDPDR